MTLQIIRPGEAFTFSGGEVHMKLATGRPDRPIICLDYSMNGFMTLCETVEIRRRLGQARIEVVYPYLPYARQDRVMDRLEPFSLKVFANLLNSLQLDAVTVFDPHSDVGPALINNCRIVHQCDLAKKALALKTDRSLWGASSVLFVSPDAGAYKKISKLIADDDRIVVGTKHRAPDGSVAETRVYSLDPLAGRDCVVVDDICDGGRTFIELGGALLALAKEEGHEVNATLTSFRNNCEGVNAGEPISFVEKAKAKAGRSWTGRNA